MEKATEKFKNKSIDELKKALNDAQEKLKVLRLEIAQAKNNKVHEVKKVRKDIARILTIIRERQWNEFQKDQGEKDEKK